MTIVAEKYAHVIGVDTHTHTHTHTRTHTCAIVSTGTGARTACEAETPISRNPEPVKSSARSHANPDGLVAPMDI